MNQTQTKNISLSPIQRKVALLVFTVMPLTGAGIDIYTPSLPAIAQHFATTQQLTQLSISVYLFFYGICQLFFGPVSDVYGRKPIFIFGVALFLFATVIMPFSGSIDIFLVLRAVQGIGVAAASCVARVALGDVFSGALHRRMVNNLAIFWALGPILAPVIGGYLQHYFNWQAPIWFLAFYALIALGLSLWAPEMHAKEKRSYGVMHAVSQYGLMLKSARFLGLALFVMLSYSVLTVFAVVGPFYVQVIMKQTAVTYGHVMMFIGIAWLFGSWLDKRTQGFGLPPPTKTKLMLVLILLCVAVAAVLLDRVFSVWLLVLFMFLIAMFDVMACLYAFGSALTSFPQAAGSGSALLGVINVAGSGVIAAFATFLKTDSLTPLFMTYFVFSSICLILAMVFMPKKVKSEI